MFSGVIPLSVSVLFSYIGSEVIKFCNTRLTFCENKTEERLNRMKAARKQDY